jgi:hypothetical protein
MIDCSHHCDYRVVKQIKRTEDSDDVVTHKSYEWTTNLHGRGLAALTNSKLQLCLNFFIAQEEEGLEDVQVVIATNSREEDLVMLHERRRILKGAKIILEEGELIITHFPGEPHQRAVLEICRQIGNYVIPHHELAFSADMSRLGEFQGRAPDAVVFSEFGSPEFVSHIH